MILIIFDLFSLSSRVILPGILGFNMSNLYPKLMRFSIDLPKKITSEEECSSDDISDITNILHNLSFDPSKGCLICDNPPLNNDLLYLNRKAEFYHYKCYIDAIRQ